jgi:hypothetical protein
LTVVIDDCPSKKISLAFLYVTSQFLALKEFWFWCRYIYFTLHIH